MCDDRIMIPKTRLIEVPFFEALYTASNPKRLPLPAGDLTALTIGPHSDIDSCMVRGANGVEPLDLNNPVFGPFQGGAAEIWHEVYQAITSNTDASATRTIFGDAISAPKLQLKAWFDCDPLVVPSETKRAAKRFYKTGLAPAAGTATWEFPCHGRERVAIALTETAGVNASVTIKGRMQRTSSLVAEDTLVSAFTLTASTEQIYFVHTDLLEYIHISLTGNGASVAVDAKVFDR